MKKIVIAGLFYLIIGLSVNAHAELEIFLNGLNAQANADINGFGIKLSTQFGVPLQQVQTVINMVENPADAFMCFQLGRMIKVQPETIVQSYKNNQGKGWGVIAKELGIKPGSSEFHALKRGDFVFTGKPGTSEAKDEDYYKDKDKDKHKDKDKDKDKHKDKDKDKHKDNDNDKHKDKDKDKDKGKGHSKN